MKQIIFASFLFLFALPSFAQELPNVSNDLTLGALNGANIRVNGYQGDVVVVQFWASWCGPCEKQMSALDEIKQNYSEKGLRILGINVDEDPKNAQSFLQARKDKTGKNLGYSVLLDQKREAVRQFHVETMPATYLIDRNGEVVKSFKGYWPGQQAELQQAIEQLLKARTPAARPAPEGANSQGNAA